MPPTELDWLHDLPTNPGVFYPSHTLENCADQLKAQGIDFPQNLQDRLKIMETSETEHIKYAYETFDSAKLIIETLKADPDFFGERFPRLDSKAAHALLVASLASDVGKTGSSTANIEEQRRVNEIYRLHNLPRSLLSKPAATAIEAIKRGGIQDNNLTAATSDYLDTFCRPLPDHPQAALDPATATMRQIFDRHIYWTHELFSEAYGADDPSTISASLHHYLEGENPTSVDLLTGPEADSAVALVAKLTILLDKTNAHLRRGKKTLRVAFIDTLKEIRTKIDALVSNAPTYNTSPKDYLAAGEKLYEDFNVLAQKIFPLERKRLTDGPTPDDLAG